MKSENAGCKTHWIRMEAAALCTHVSGLARVLTRRFRFLVSALRNLVAWCLLVSCSAACLLWLRLCRLATRNLHRPARRRTLSRSDILVCSGAHDKSLSLQTAPEHSENRMGTLALRAQFLTTIRAQMEGAARPRTLSRRDLLLCRSSTRTRRRQAPNELRNWGPREGWGHSHIVLHFLRAGDLFGLSLCGLVFIVRHPQTLSMSFKQLGAGPGKLFPSFKYSEGFISQPIQKTI